ncbi:MAG: hypothetical protein ACOYM3_20430 [Terrimicrobiaceae bacterium]
MSAVVAGLCAPDAISAKRLADANERLRARHRDLRKIFKTIILPVARETISKMESLQKERLKCFCVLRKCAQIFEQMRQGHQDEAGLPGEVVPVLKEWMVLGGDAEVVLDKITDGFSVATALSGGAFSTNAGRGIASPDAVAAFRGSANISLPADDDDRIGPAQFAIPGLLASPVITFASVPVKCRDEDSEDAAARTFANMECQEMRLRREMEAIRDIGLRADELRESASALREKASKLLADAANQPHDLAASAVELFKQISTPLTTTL